MTTDANTYSKPSSYSEVLTIRSFRSLWFAQIFSQLAINTLLFVLGLRIYQNTGSNTAVSGLFLAYGIPSVLFGMIAGTAVDHLDKRRMLMYCDILRGGLVLLLLFVSSNIFLVYLVTFVNAVITQFYVPSEAPLIPRLVPSELLVPANSLFSFTFYSSLAVGTVLSGPLLRGLGPQWIFLVISALFFFAVWFESRLPSQAVGVFGFTNIFQYHIPHMVSRIFEELFEGIRYVRTSPALLDSLLLLTGTQIIFAMLGTLGPGFADRVLHIDVRDASLYIVGPAVLGIIAGALWVGVRGYKLKPNRLIKLGVTGAGVILLLISLTVRIHVALIIEMVLFFCLGAANSLLDAPANSILQDEAKGSMRGRVYGMLTAAVGGVGVLPVIIGGVLADVVGVGHVILLLGLIILTYGIWRMKYNKE
ncbi:MAG: MFS transporter [Candidatus Gottesmanbacteria bacterium]|nr:MFS transporter [Candidatus Gottesmanbacteria bacterium]